VAGTVWGVGFRPHGYRRATDLELGGDGLNDAKGGLLEVEGDAGAVERFLALLEAEAPPLALVESVVAEAVPAAGQRHFEPTA